jgi:hypothetical protein
VEYSLDELTAAAKACAELKHANIRVTGSFTGDLTSSGSPRCKVWWSKANGLSVVDYKTGKTHHPVGGADDPEVTQLFSDIFRKRTV